MKRFIMSALAVLCAAVSVSAQDIITTKDGSDIKAKILEVNSNEVKYKKFNNLDGPTFTMPKSDILIVRYENGENEVFKTSKTTTYNSAQNTTDEIVPGMKYSQINKIYNAKDYVPQPGDPYSRGWAGVASLFIPGLGEGVAGEWGRAAAIIGANVGLSVLAYTQYDDYTGEVTDLFYVCAAARVILNVWSIIDAVHVAKVKNMYNQDLRSQRAGVDLKVEPYFAYTPVGVNNNYKPAAGLSLKFNF